MKAEETTDNLKKGKEKREKEEKRENLKWCMEVIIMTFILSITFSYISSTAIKDLSLIPAVFILVFVIFIGIITDIVGVAVQVANEEEFHAKATKKAKGAKTSLKLIHHAPRVANFCSDVIGDICGVLSGAISAMIAAKITEKLSLGFDAQFLISALVASLTVGGKAIGKNIAKENSTPIIYFTGKLVNIFHREK